MCVHISIITSRRIPRTRFVRINIQLLHICIRELKVVYLRILLDPRLRDGLWQRYKALLQAPTEKDLRGRFVVRFADRSQYRLFIPRSANKRRVCLLSLAVFLHNSLYLLTSRSTPLCSHQFTISLRGSHGWSST